MKREYPGFDLIEPNDLDHWAVATSSAGRDWLVDQTTEVENSRGGLTSFGRAYRMLDGVNPRMETDAQGQPTKHNGYQVLRFSFPAFLTAGVLPVLLDVVEFVPLAGLDAEDKQRWAALVNSAESARRELRAERLGLVTSAGSFRPPGDGQRGARQ
jgi:hypothetical protein